MFLYSYLKVSERNKPHEVTYVCANLAPDFDITKRSRISQHKVCHTHAILYTNHYTRAHSLWCKVPAERGCNLDTFGYSNCRQ